VQNLLFTYPVSADETYTYVHKNVITQETNTYYNIFNLKSFPLFNKLLKKVGKNIFVFTNFTKLSLLKRICTILLKNQEQTAVVLSADRISE